MNDTQPVFMKLMDVIENEIVAGVYRTDDLIISTTQISKVYSVNPATAVKAVSKLTDAGILYKKRGIGMCVAGGARMKIIKRRKDVFLNQTVNALLEEAKTLDISLEELIRVIKIKERKKS